MIERRTQGLRRRYRNERVLIWCGKFSVGLALLFLLGLFVTLSRTGWRGLLRAELALDVTFTATVASADDPLAYEKTLRTAIKENLLKEGSKRRQAKELRKLFSSLGGALALHDVVVADVNLVGTTMRMWVPASSLAASYLKGGTVDRLSEFQVGLLRKLHDAGRTRLRFNNGFFTNGDSRSPELAGIGGALVGSLLALLVTFVVSFPLAVGAAVHLELFAPRNWLFDFIEININNLAAVPSIIKGLLGLAVFINLFGMPRSSPLVGGMVLALLTLPTIIVAARAALGAVSGSLLHAAMSLGATRLQAVTHHVLPAAMPGILTGTIIGMSHALGETAPLLMIGMVAFVVAVPGSFTDVATTLPVQIFLWADQPERGYVELTALAICVLLVFLLVMNSLAIFLRNRLEHK